MRESADREDGTDERYRWDHRVHTRTIGKTTVDERTCEIDPPAERRDEALDQDEYFLRVGEVDRGLAELRQAQELDPLSLIVNTLLGMAHYRLHEYEQAQTQLRKTLELDPNFHLMILRVCHAKLLTR